MPDDEYETVSSDPVFRIVRSVVPWVAFALVLWVLAGVWGGFQRSKAVVESTTAAEPTVTAPAAQPSASTTVTGMVALARVDVQLRTLPDTNSEVLATAKKGSTMTVLNRQGTYFRVKDAAGHIGWIPNDVHYIDIRVKAATKAKKKK